MAGWLHRELAQVSAALLESCEQPSGYEVLTHSLSSYLSTYLPTYLPLELPVKVQGYVYLQTYLPTALPAKVQCYVYLQTYLSLFLCSSIKASTRIFHVDTSHTGTNGRQCMRMCTCLRLYKRICFHRTRHHSIYCKYVGTMALLSHSGLPSYWGFALNKNAMIGFREG